MEESAPQNLPKDDILTPQDSLEMGTQVSVTPVAGTSLDASGTAMPQPAASRDPVQISDGVGNDTPEAGLPKQRFGGLLQNRLIRRVGLASAILLGFIAILVLGTLVFQKTNKGSLSQAERVAQIQDQAVNLKDTTATTGPNSLRVGVPTLFVNGDVSIQGVLRINNGDNYGQFDGTGVTGKQTYRLPNESGTICLDSGNCGGVTAAQLAALGVSVAAINAATNSNSTATATTNGGVQSLNGSVGAINLQGTANQITITNSNGTVSFALPQDMAVTSVPTFGGLTLNGTATQNGYDLCDNSNNCGFARGDLAILQGGNAYSTNIIMGAYDNYGLSLITNNTDRLSITNNGLITLGGATTDRLRALAEFSGSTPLVFQGATDNFFRTSIVVTDPTANRNIILPNADGTICLTSGNCSGAGGYGDILNGGNTFNSAITLGTNDNYGFNIKTFNTNRVTISNTGVINLLGDTSINANATLGASSASRLTLLGQLTGATPLVFQGATNDSFATSFVITDPTANRTIVFPNADGTVCLSSGNCGGGLGGSGDILQGGNNFGGTFVVGANDNFGLELKTNNLPRLTITNTGNATFGADLVVNGSVTLGDSSADRLHVNGQLTGGTPLVFQGTTDNAFATYFTIADPTANRTIIVPNADGTICLSSGNCSTSGGTGDVNNGGNNYNSLMVLGTNDNFGLTLKTNNTNRISISNTGLTTVLADFVVDGNTLLGASSTNSTTLQGSDLFAPNNLNIDTYTQYIDTLNNTVGFGVIPGATSRVSILSSAGGDALTVNNGNGSGNILNLQDNGVNVVTVANNGITTFKNSADSSASFQIQNANGNSLFNTDTTNQSVNINGGPSTFSFTASGDLLINRTEYTTATNTTGAVTTGDFNGDTWPDIASTNYQSSSVSVFMNNGNGTFANKVDYTTLSGPRGVKTGDFDGDGDLDLVIADGHNFAVSISVLMNNGNGTFATKVDYIAAPSNSTIDMVEVADLNGDNRLDIVTSGTANAAVFINNGNGTFAPRVDYSFTNTARSLALADYNGDGSVDIAGAIPGINRISILSNNGNGTFGAATLYTVSGPMRGLVAGDVNGDGRPDLATILDSGSMTVLINNGAGAFLSQANYTAGTQAGVNSLVGSIDMADYNSDGILDIITANVISSTTSVFLNNGNGTFSTQYQYTAGGSPNAVDSADFNKDGKVDAAINNGVGNKMSVLFGNGGITTRSNSLSVLPATINQTGIYVKANVGQAADLIRVTDSGGSNAVFSIGATGAALFKNGTDSANAFQLQTAAGSTALNFNSTTNQISLYNNGSATMGNFTQLSNSLLGARANHGTVSYNGFIYTVGGMGSTSVMYATVSGGNTGAWVSTTSLPAARSNSSVFVANGYIYAVGGYSAGATSTAYYAQLNGDGTVGTWNTTTSLPSARYGAATMTNNGYVYVIGGSDSSHTPTTTAYYAALNSNGTLGAWQTATALPQQVRFAKAVVNNGYIYVMGGGNNSNTTVNTIYYASINVNGSLGAWTTSGVTMPYAAQSHELFSYGGNIYLLGGCSGGLAAGDSCFSGAPAFATVASTTPGVGGSLSAWQTSTTSSILGGRAAFGLTVTGGYAYLTGGYYPGISTSTSLVLAAALPGSNSGTTFNSTSATFNTTVNIQNADNSYLMIANPGNNTLTVGATTTFKNITDSTAGFKVQNAAGSNILNIDTANKTIGVNGASTYSFTPAGPLFTTGVGYTTAAGGSGVATGKLNADTYPDFVTANFSANSVSVLINNGNGTFATKVDYATPASSTPNYLTVSDLNGDGRDDIAVSNRTNNTASVFLNNGDGTFGARADYAVGTGPQEIASGDLNGDTYRDLVIANYNTNNISVLMNNGNGTFATKVDYATFTSAQSVEIADLNNDNRGDIIVGGGTTTPSNNRLAVFMNSGTGTFPARTDYSGVGATSNGLVAGDFNSDGFIDIASSYYYANLAQVYLNNGNGTLAAGVNYAVGYISLSITSGDYNGDGAIDLVIGNGNGLTYSILLGNGNGTFGPQTEVATGTYSAGVATADFNQDGKQDVVRTNNTSTATVMMGQGSITTVKVGLSVAPASPIDTALYVKGLTGQAADLVRVADGNGSAVLGIGANGAVLFKNGTDNANALQVQNAAGTSLLNLNTTTSALTVGTTALFKNQANSASSFQVQNAAGASLFNVDTTTNKLTALGNNSGELAPWATNTNSLPAARYNTATFNANGYMYVIGGTTGFALQNTIYYAKINADGSTGAFTTNATNLPATITYPATAVSNGYVYLFGGNNGTNVISTVYSAKLNADGSIGAWTALANSLPAARVGANAVIYNGYVYVMGGHNDSAVVVNSVYSAKLNADGTVGAWTTSGNSLPAARTASASVVSNGYVYVIGGSTSSLASVPTTAIYYAALNTDGSLGTWSTSANGLPAARNGGSAAIMNGYVYYLGGIDGVSAQSTVFYSKLNIDGTNGTWTTAANALPDGRSSIGSTALNGYVYVVGGYAPNNFAQTTVYYASMPRIQVGGSLDLVGLQVLSLTGSGDGLSGSSGGSITAGNGMFVGSLQVQGSAAFARSLLASGNLTVNGSALFKNSTDSTNAFQVQSSTGMNVLQADTTNNLLYVGNTTADATGTLLVLDTKNTIGDPTGINGAMYYNSFLSKFRCYQAGAWADCAGGASAGSILQDGNTLGVPVTIGTNDNFGLNFETNGTTVASLSNTGQALFKNASNSTTAFQIQNATSGALFTADTTGNIVSIGGTPSATPTLLLLANGNNVTDPTGYDGATYYNSAINRFRCYENGGWKNCITSGGGGGGGDILNGGNSGLGNMSIGNIDAGRLDLITSNQVRLRVSAGGNVAVNSTGTLGTVENFRVNTPTTVDNAAASILSSGGAANKGLVIQGAASQTANLQEWQTSNGIARVGVTSAGEFRIYDSTGLESTRFVSSANGSLSILTTAASGSSVTIAPDGGLNLGTGSTDAVVIGRSGGDRTVTVRGNTVMTATSATTALTVRGVSGQSANLQEWQANGGGLLASVNASGYFSINNGALLDRFSSQSRIAAAAGTGLYVTDSSGNGLYVANGGNVGINNAATANKLSVNAPTTADALAQLIVATGATTNKGIVVQRAASQTANLLEFQASTGTLLTSVKASGALSVTSAGTAGTVESFRVNTPTTVDNLANAIISTSATTNKALVLQGTASQTANIFEVQGSTGTVLASVSAAGMLTGTNVTATNSYTVGGGTAASIGAIRLVNTQSINWRNAANTANILGVSVTSSDVLQLGAAVTTNDATATASIGTTGTAKKGLVIQGVASQSANLFEVQSSTGAMLNSINSAGDIVFGQGANHSIGINANTTVNGNGYALTVQGGQANGSGTGGDLNLYGGGAGGGLNQSGAVNLTTTSAFGVSGNINITTGLGGFAGGTINLQTGVNGSSQYTQINLNNAGGRVNIGAALNSAKLSIVNDANTTGDVVLAVRGSSGQTGNLQQWQNSAGTPLAAVGANGTLSFNNLGSATSAVDITSGGVGTGSILLGANAGYIQKWLGSGNDNVLVTVAPNATVGTPTQSGGLILLGTSYWNGSAAVSENLQLQSQRNSTNAGDYFLQVSGGIKIYNQYSGAVATIVRGASGQVARLQEWQNYAGTVLASIDANGNMTLNGDLNIATGKLQVAGVDRLDNSGNLVNVTFNGNTIGVGYGGTGATTLTSNGILFGNGTGAIQSTAAGNSGQCLLGNTGLAPSWGSCAPAAAGNINQGGNNFGSDVTLGATDNYGFNILTNNVAVARFSASGQATFQNGADSATALQVQNAAGTSLFTIDSANSRIYVGNPTADSVGTVLVLDTKNTAGDPTGVNGAMYYNSNLGKFRCYENSTWKDCIYTVLTAAKTADQTFSSTSYSDISDLSFSVLASKVYKLSCTLLVSVPSGTNGGNLSTNGPASPSQLTATFAKSLDQSSGDNYATSSSYDDASAATTFKVNTVSTGANRFIVNYNAILVNGANNGTWSLRSKAFDGSSSITMYANSSCELKPL